MGLKQKGREKNISVLIGGGGQLGKALVKRFKRGKGKVVVLEGIRPGQKNLIPQNASEVLFLVNSRDYRSDKLTPDLFFANVTLLAQALREASGRGVSRFAFFSSGSVYAPSVKARKEDSSIPLSDLSPYAAVKCCGEALAGAYAPFFKRVVIYRPFFIYGPGQNPKMLFSLFFKNAKRKKAVKITGRNGVIFNPVYADDAARFVEATLRLDRPFDVYNIAGSEKTTLRDVFISICGLVKERPRLEFYPGREKVILGDIKKMREEGFRHKVFLEAGLKRMHKGLKQKGSV